MQLQCLPAGLCSWDFRIIGDAGTVGLTRLNFATEQGSVEIGNAPYEVVKDGVLSGRWSLTDGNREIAAAEKPNPLTRRLLLTHDGQTYTLQAQSVVGRSFELLHNDQQLARFEREHPFTRRSTIAGDPTLPMETVAFAFWLVALMWRRAARSSGSGGGAAGGGGGA